LARPAGPVKAAGGFKARATSFRRGRDKIAGQNSGGEVGGEAVLRTVAVIALKGGSGKTTVATHLALAAHLRGIDTLVIDTDPQHSSRDVLSARDGPGPACALSSGSTLLAAQFAAVGVHKQLLIIDTAAGAVENVSEAIVLADLAVMVVRPTLLDIAGLARTFRIVQRLGKPAIVVVNQAPVARESVEAPLVKRALAALEYMQAPVAPVILRARSIYQTALERGRSAEEMTDRAAAREMGDLWSFVGDQLGLETKAPAQRIDAHPS
jgi:chromosome partitioning protein